MVMQRAGAFMQGLGQTQLPQIAGQLLGERIGYESPGQQQAQEEAARQARLQLMEAGFRPIGEEHREQYEEAGFQLQPGSEFLPEGVELEHDLYRPMQPPSPEQDIALQEMHRRELQLPWHDDPVQYGAALQIYGEDLPIMMQEYEQLGHQARQEEIEARQMEAVHRHLYGGDAPTFGLGFADIEGDIPIGAAGELMGEEFYTAPARLDREEYIADQERWAAEMAELERDMLEDNIRDAREIAEAFNMPEEISAALSGINMPAQDAVDLVTSIGTPHLDRQMAQEELRQQIAEADISEADRRLLEQRIPLILEQKEADIGLTEAQIPYQEARTAAEEALAERRGVEAEQMERQVDSLENHLLRMGVDHETAAGYRDVTGDLSDASRVAQDLLRTGQIHNPMSLWETVQARMSDFDFLLLDEEEQEPWRELERDLRGQILGDTPATEEEAEDIIPDPDEDNGEDIGGADVDERTLGQRGLDWVGPTEHSPWLGGVPGTARDIALDLLHEGAERREERFEPPEETEPLDVPEIETPALPERPEYEPEEDIPLTRDVFDVPKPEEDLTPTQEAAERFIEDHQNMGWSRGQFIEWLEAQDEETRSQIESEYGVGVDELMDALRGNENNGGWLDRILDLISAREAEALETGTAGAPTAPETGVLPETAPGTAEVREGPPIPTELTAPERAARRTGEPPISPAEAMRTGEGPDAPPADPAEEAVAAMAPDDEPFEPIAGGLMGAGVEPAGPDPRHVMLTPEEQAEDQQIAAELKQRASQAIIGTGVDAEQRAELWYPALYQAAVEMGITPSRAERAIKMWTQSMGPEWTESVFNRPVEDVWRYLEEYNPER